MTVIKNDRELRSTKTFAMDGTAGVAQQRQ